MKYQRIGLLFVAAIAFIASPVFSAQSYAVQTNTNNPQRFIVTFNKDIKASDKAAVRSAGAETLKELKLVDGLVVNAPNATVVKNLYKISGVDRIEIDARASVYAPPSCSPWPSCRDGSQDVSQPEQLLPWGIDRIEAEKTWDTTTGQNVKVAVIDTGIDKDHPDLKNNIAGGANFIVSKGPSWKAPDTNAWDDDNGHGTHVAGTIAATDNTIGVVGVAHQASLYGVKVLDKSGSGYVSDIISGIEWSITNGMDVINMSLGSSSDVQAFHDAVDAAYSAGIIVVAAAGNSGDNDSSTNNVGYPAKYSSVIAVAATDNNNNVAYFSSDGTEVELSAPGVSVLSTIVGGDYGTMNGTSMASPHVAGAAAAVLAAPVIEEADTNGDGVWSASEVRAHLRTTTDDLGATGRDVFYGYGLINVERAVANP